MQQKLIFVSILFIISIISISAMFFYILIKNHNQWKSDLKKFPIDRMFNNKESFVKFYSKKGYSTGSISFIYDNTQKFLNAKDVVLLPNDDLIKMYEREEDEWLDIIPKWFEKQDWQKPETNVLKESLKKYKQINFEYLIELVGNYLKCSL